MVEAIEAARGDVAEPEEIDREKLVVRLPDDLMFEYLRKRLTENDCRNRGYILDGFPRTYRQAREIFLVKPKKFEESGEEIPDDEEPPEEGKEKSYAGYVIRQDIFPKSCILFDSQSDEQLMRRIKDNLPEWQVKGTHYNAEDMKRRIKAYRVANNSQVAEPPLKQFFEENGIQLHTELDCCGTPQDQILRSLKIYIERFEKPFNYMTFDSELEKVHVAE
jgi:adenylate kinase